jgi:hypothetical protein
MPSCFLLLRVHVFCRMFIAHRESLQEQCWIPIDILKHGSRGVLMCVEILE